MQIDIKQAKKLLKQNEVIAVPTETVYGLAVDIASEEAILKLYNLKKRPSRKPLVIQLASTHDLPQYLNHVPFDLEKITNLFWPGPLTLILPVKKNKVPGLLRANLETCAFRITECVETRDLIEQYGPIAITSANISSQNAALSEKEIEATFGENFPILEAQYVEFSGLPSTILAYIDASWGLVRQGSITLKELRTVLGYNPPFIAEVHPESGEYILRPQLHLKEEPFDGSIQVVLGFSDRRYPGAEHILHLGSLNEPESIARQVPECLKHIQAEGYSHVWVDMDFPKTGSLKKVAELLERAVRSGS